MPFSSLLFPISMLNDTSWITLKIYDIIKVVIIPLWNTSTIQLAIHIDIFGVIFVKCIQWVWQLINMRLPIFLKLVRIRKNIWGIFGINLLKNWARFQKSWHLGIDTRCTDARIDFISACSSKPVNPVSLSHLLKEGRRHHLQLLLHPRLIPSLDDFKLRKIMSSDRGFSLI